MIRVALIVSLLAAAACPKSSPDGGAPPSPLDASVPYDGGDPCPAACATLAGLTCPEGQDPNCATVCERAVGMHVIAPEVFACAAAARSTLDARACGIRCGQ